MHLQTSLQHVVYALSDMLDLVGIDDAYHGKRVAWMAHSVAQQLHYSDCECDALFYAGLLHDCGVSSTVTHQCLIREMDWDGSQEHCIRGAALLAPIRLLSPLAPVVRYHHTHWESLLGLLPDMPDPWVAHASNLIFLVDRVDALAAPHLGANLLVHIDDIQQRINDFSGTLFNPELVQAFLAASNSDAFWLTLEPRHLQSFLGRKLHSRTQPYAPLDYLGLKSMAALFSNVVDAKSPFTAAHSQGVAALSRKLGEIAGLDSITLDKLELAGLFHDLGKLQIPDAILEKPGKLNREERLFMRRHSFETYQILCRIPGLEEIAMWAAYHHETLDGGGYPYHLGAGKLPLPARIVAVADVFQALAQHRPYRASLPPDQILIDLQQRVAEGQLDTQVVNWVADHLPDCWDAAHCMGV